MKKLLIAGMINLLLLNIVLAEDKWQYTVFNVRLDINAGVLETLLKPFGLGGWELISANKRMSSWDHYFIFKKKIENEDD